MGEIPGSHGREFEDGCLLGCFALSFDRIIAAIIKAVTTTETSAIFHSAES
jgi:hypothetical protein